MSDIGISADDRERLARTKFSEFLNELADDNWFEERYNKAREKRLGQSNQPDPGQHHSEPQPPQRQSQQPPQRQRRRNLLEECLSNSFGW